MAMQRADESQPEDGRLLYEAESRRRVSWSPVPPNEDRRSHTDDRSPSPLFRGISSAWEWLTISVHLAQHFLTQVRLTSTSDMTSSNSWAEFAAVFCQTRAAFLDHEVAKVELKKLMPEDAREAVGHGIRAKRSKSGAISFDLNEAPGGGHAAL